MFGHDGPRQFAVTPAEARLALEDFVVHRLAEFGPWQDAMVPGERNLFHALLSVPLNLGVLPPLDAVRAAEAAYRAGRAPLQSVEGFIRQVIGWREYVWGMYWLRVERWPHDNALGAGLPLPAAYWGAPVGWECLDEVTAGVEADGYAHHIQRLMVLGPSGSPRASSRGRSCAGSRARSSTARNGSWRPTPRGWRSSPTAGR
jgi:deoxyribodipyrimidine photolyase-related protein